MANPADVVDIIQTPVLIKDEFIRSGTIVLDEDGDPIHYTGGFAIVFPFFVNQTKWAFRVWYNSVGDVGKRLKILSNELNKINLPYFCSFHYSEEGVVLDGSVRPTTRMIWVDGMNLKDYICCHAKEKDALDRLAANFMRMCTELHHREIAHGDLQHGNILVNNSGDISLIDYDSVYLPALKGERDIITGLAAYQHPARVRKENKFASHKLDYFSELIIYLSIVAISEQPGLVDKYKLMEGDNLLFIQEDFKDLTNATIYKDLIALSENVNALLAILTGYLKETDINRLQPFETYFHVAQEAHYCIFCGHKFGRQDMYCINCGKART